VFIWAFIPWLPTWELWARAVGETAEAKDVQNRNSKRRHQVALTQGS
jgi:hypothetical protein